MNRDRSDGEAEIYELANGSAWFTCRSRKILSVKKFEIEGW
jgi:hypothetical protein